MKRIEPKKSLGQNFLTDNNIARKIVAALNCLPGDYILEIGPGTGALTFLLAELPVNLTAVEIDERAVEVLREKLDPVSYPNVSIVNQDFADFDIESFTKKNCSGKKLRVIGNIPYYLSSEIFFKLFYSSPYIENAVLMVQKEVAARLNSKPRTKDYGILSLAVERCGKSYTRFDVPPSCFFPKPNVTSSVIEIKFNDEQTDAVSFASYMSLVRAAFNQRRKTLRNALKSYIETNTGQPVDEFINQIPEKEKTYFSKRAEELTKDDFEILKSLINLHRGFTLTK